MSSEEYVLCSAKEVNRATHKLIKEWKVSQAILKAMASAAEEGHFQVYYEGLCPKDVLCLQHHGFRVIVSDNGHCIIWSDDLFA
jgi:hypothetical protein